MGSKEKSTFLTLGQSELTRDLPEQIAEWTPEPELTFHVPRGVVLKRERVIFLAILFLVLSTMFLLTMWDNWEWSSDRLLFRAVFLCGWLALGGLLSHAARRQIQLSKLLVSRGTATRGTITACEDFPDEGWDTYSVAYDTPTKHFLTCRLNAGTKVGDMVTILHLPEAPDKAMPYKNCDYKAALVPEE